MDKQRTGPYACSYPGGFQSLLWKILWHPRRCFSVTNELSWMASLSPFPGGGTSHSLHSLLLMQPGGNCYLEQVCYITAICTTLHKFLVVISTNISIQQSFSSCIQPMVGELFFLICIMAYECVIL